jgi:hypothetical protein
VGALLSGKKTSFARNGLFSLEFGFKKGQIFTEYCGKLISREEALFLREDNQGAYLRGLGHHMVIDGYRE